MKGNERILARFSLLNTHPPPARDTYYKVGEYFGVEPLSYTKVIVKIYRYNFRRILFFHSRKEISLCYIIYHYYNQLAQLKYYLWQCAR